MMGAYGKRRVVVIGLLLLLFLGTGFPCSVWGQDEEDPNRLIVSPTTVDMGTYRLLPDQGLDAGSFTISVAGGPTPGEDQKATFIASTDASWMTLDPASGEIPGTITVTVTISELMEGTFQGTIVVTSGLDASKQAEVTVTMTVIRTPGNLLTVSPSNLELEFTTADLTSRTFAVEIRNADPTDNSFLWSATIEAGWLALSPSSGTGTTTATLTVDPSKIVIPAGQDVVEGKIVFHSSLTSDAVELVVRARVVAVSGERLMVSPTYLFWSLERPQEGAMSEATPQTLFILSQDAGWFVNYDAPFIVVSSDNQTQVSGNTRTASLSVNVDVNILQSYDYGRYSGQIVISNVSGDAYRVVPVIVDIRRPGDSITPPPPPPVVSQSSPGFVQVETNDSSWFNMILAAPATTARYPGPGECQAAGGTWVDPDGLAGSLDEWCSLDEKIYVLMTFPDIQPGVVYAYSARHPQGMAVVFKNGVKTEGADQFFYASGPVASIPVGPLRPLGLKGMAIISVRVGTNLANASEVQRCQVNIRTPEGSWVVSEYFQGQLYHYGTERPLTLKRETGSLNFVGTWGDTPVVCRPGDGASVLYVLEFNEDGGHYVYEITHFTTFRMIGRWRSNVSDKWEQFEASRIAFW